MEVVTLIAVQFSLSLVIYCCFLASPGSRAYQMHEKWLCDHDHTDFMHNVSDVLLATLQRTRRTKKCSYMQWRDARFFSADNLQSASRIRASPRPEESHRSAVSRFRALRFNRGRQVSHYELLYMYSYTCTHARAHAQEEQIASQQSFYSQYKSTYRCREKSFRTTGVKRYVRFVRHPPYGQ